MICVLGSVAEAEPAEFVFADDAGHVVAALVLFDFSFAHRAKAHAAVLRDPAFEFRFHIVFTSAAVPFVSALEADLRCTDRAAHLYCF